MFADRHLNRSVSEAHAERPRVSFERVVFLREVLNRGHNVWHPNQERRWEHNNCTLSRWESPVILSSKLLKAYIHPQISQVGPRRRKTGR